MYYEQILEQVQLAEELGCECFMFNEHHFLDYSRLAANPAVFLAAAAARMSRIRLGSCTAKLLPGIVTVEPLPKRRLIRDLVTDIVPDAEKWQ